LEYSIDNIALLISEKLQEALAEFHSNELKLVDIGVFPWHSTIEISLLFSSDDAYEDDISDWPYYDYSKMSEGGWDRGKELTSEIKKIWDKNKDANPIFKDFGEAINSNKVRGVNVDNNYCSYP